MLYSNELKAVVITENFLDNPKFRIPSHIYTLLMLTLAGVIFCSRDLSHAAELFKAMFVWTDNPALHASDVITVWGAALAVIAAFFCGPIQQMVPGLKRCLYQEDRIFVWEIPILIALLAVSIFVLSGNAYNPFIYFRF